MDDTTHAHRPPDPLTLPPLEPFEFHNPGMPHVVIGIVTAGVIQVETVKSLLALNAASDRINATIVLLPNGPYMDAGRNRMMAQWFTNPALATAERMIFVDSDVVFTVDDVCAIAYSEHHIIGGAYASPHNGKNFVVAYRYDRPDDEPGTGGITDILRDLEVDELDAMSGPSPVDAIGTGFLGISRAAAIRFTHYYESPEPWFAELSVNRPNTDEAVEAITGVHLGEDITFCLRAWAIGIPVHIDPTVRLIHFKTLGVQMPPHPSQR
jgi:hypothetical protein